MHAGTQDGFIDGAFLSFRSSNDKEDYHGEMNYNIFTKWVEEKLIPNLPKNSVVVIDNASYHNALEERLPTMSSRKDEIIDFLVDKVN